MKSLAVALALFALFAVSSATEQFPGDGQITVVKITTEGNGNDINSINNDEPLSIIHSFAPFRFLQTTPFRSFFSSQEQEQEQEPEPFGESLSHIIDKFFNFDNLHNDEPILTVHVNVQSSSSPMSIPTPTPISIPTMIEQQESTENPMSSVAEHFNSIFTRLHRFVQEMSAPTPMIQSQESIPRPRAGCQLLRACAEDIDNFCAVARLSQVQGALERCLKGHHSKLSEQCSSVLDAHLDEEKEQEDAPQQTEQTPVEIIPAAPIVPETPAETPATPTTEVTPIITPAVPITPQPVDETPKPVVETPKPIVETPKPVVETPKPIVETPKPVVETPRFVEIPKTQEARILEKLPAVCVEDAKDCVSSANTGTTLFVGTMACLNLKKNKLSAECRRALAPTPVFSCSVDIVKYCGNVRGHQNVIDCLSTQQLSTDCLTSLRAFKTVDPDVDGSRVVGDDRNLNVKNTAMSFASLKKAPVVPITIGLVALVVIVAVVVVVRRNRRRCSSSKFQVQLANPHVTAQTA